jgi:MerR family transcriptional regulator, heat shock protein HspR
MKRIGRNRPLYMISVAAELTGVHPQTLRIYERKALVSPQRSQGNTRLYSEADIERLRLIQQLTQDEGINLAGVTRIIVLQREIDRLKEELDAARHRAARAERIAVQAAARACESANTSLVRISAGAVARRRA